MQIHVMRAKIHGATVTQAELNYTGSLTLDEDLMDAAGMFANEKVQVVNRNTGSRIETYLIKGQRGSGVCCLNGPAARMGAVGDVVVIITYGIIDEKEARAWEPVRVFVDAQNRQTTL